mmetsp:Transcript_47568/g.146508  ORF Transcript_47568/g.146508 Transcript_47568/m.146508 type:complete len:235 (-) Transcript_47568:16-720(-)
MVAYVWRFQAACDLGAKMNSKRPGEWALMGVISCTPAACTMPMRPPCQVVVRLLMSIFKASSTVILPSGAKRFEGGPPWAMAGATGRAAALGVNFAACTHCPCISSASAERSFSVLRMLRSALGLLNASSATCSDNCSRRPENSSSVAFMASERSPLKRDAWLSVSKTVWWMSLTASFTGCTRTTLGESSSQASANCSIIFSSFFACCARPEKAAISGQQAVFAAPPVLTASPV